MLTVMLQVSQLKKLVVGQDHPTVITFDMALYEKAVQLLDSRPDLKKEVVPRLGELHAVMAALRALGPQWRILALMMHELRQMYMGPLQQDRSSSVATTREHSVHTSIRTWLCTNLLWNSSLQRCHILTKSAQSQQRICRKHAPTHASGASDGLESIRIANSSLLQVLTNEDVIQQLKKWEGQKSSNAMFKVDDELPSPC